MRERQEAAPLLDTGDISESHQVPGRGPNLCAEQSRRVAPKARLEHHADVEIRALERVAKTGRDQAIIGASQRSREVVEDKSVLTRTLFIDQQSNLAGTVDEVVLDVGDSRRRAQEFLHLSGNPLRHDVVVPLDPHRNGLPNRGTIARRHRAQVGQRKLRVGVPVGAQRRIHTLERPLGCRLIFGRRNDGRVRERDVGRRTTLPTPAEPTSDIGGIVEYRISEQRIEHFPLDLAHHPVRLVEPEVGRRLVHHEEVVVLTREEIHREMRRKSHRERDQRGREHGKGTAVGQYQVECHQVAGSQRVEAAVDRGPKTRPGGRERSHHSAP